MFQTIIKDILSVDISIHLAFLTTRGPDNEVEVELVNRLIRTLRENQRNCCGFIEGGFQVFYKFY